MREEKDIVHPVSRRARKNEGAAYRGAAGPECYEAGLKRSGELLERIFQSQKDAVVILEARAPRTIIECNCAITGILGYDPKEVIGKMIDFLIGDAGAQERFERALARDVGARGGFRLDGFRFVHKDGEYVDVEIDAVPLKDQNGDGGGFVCFVRCTGDRRCPDGVPRERYSFQSAVVANAAEGLCIGHSTNAFPYLRFTVWNKQMTAITGYTMEEINRLGWYQTMHGDEDGVRQARERVARIPRGEDLRDEEWEITRPGGEKRILSISTAGIETSEGEVHTLALMHDITGKIRAEEALRESEARFRELADNIREVFWVRAQGEMLYIGPAFEKIWGFSRDNLYADPTSFMNLIHEDDRDRVRGSYQRHKVDGEFNEEYRLVRPDGQMRWVWTRSFPIWKDGKVVRTIGISEDVTERKLAEERLRNNKTTLRAVFDGISDPLILVDGNMRVVMLNRAARLIYGIAESDSIAYGKPCFTSLMGKNEPCEGCDCGTFIARGERASFERRGFRKPGGIEQITIFPVEGESGEVGAAVVQIRDVTEAKRIERELIHADKMISLGVLVSGVAHEINNPNSFIMLNTPLLHEAWESVTPILERYYEENGDFSVGGLPYSEMREEVVKLFLGLLEGSRRIDRIVQELKRFSRMESIDAEEIVHVNEVIRNASSLVGNLIRKSTDLFSIYYGVNLPPLRGSAQKLEQVVINLIRNACQALSDKTKAVRVYSKYDAVSGNITIEVQDQGVGIPEEILPRIMDPFFTTRQSRGGTGLGLSVCANIVREHGGTIQVESLRGQGTTFTVSLPTNQGPGRLPKILVAVGDGADRRDVVGTLTENRRYIVYEASNGIETCLKLGADRPDLLVVDVRTPDMNGLEICRAMEYAQELSGMGAIVVGESTSLSELEALVKKGFVSIVSHPVRAKELLEAVESVLGGVRMRKP